MKSRKDHLTKLATICLQMINDSIARLRFPDEDDDRCIVEDNIEHLQTLASDVARMLSTHRELQMLLLLKNGDDE